MSDGRDMSHADIWGRNSKMPDLSPQQSCGLSGSQFSHLENGNNKSCLVRFL